MCLNLIAPSLPLSTLTGSFGPNFIDTSFGAEYVYEMGPLTLGHERWANLSPAEHELQSFGYASVSEDGDLEIKLMGIDGSVKFERKLATEGTPTEIEAEDGKSSATSTEVSLAVCAAVVPFFLL